MTKLVLVAAIAFTCGAAATAVASSSAWRVFATGSDDGDYGAYASASADAPRSHALAVRATSAAGKPVKVSIYLSCQADLVAASGRVVVLGTPLFKKCSVSGSANTDYAGRAKVELLRR